MTFVRIAALAALVLLASCATNRAPASPFEPVSGPSTALQHVVLVKLIDSSQSDELIADMDAHLAPIESIGSYWRGACYESNRPEVKRDFDVGLVIEFRDAAAYEAYSSDPRHIDIVKRWKPKCTSLVIYDVAAAAAR